MRRRKRRRKNYVLQTIKQNLFSQQVFSTIKKLFMSSHISSENLFHSFTMSCASLLDFVPHYSNQCSGPNILNLRFGPCYKNVCMHNTFISNLSQLCHILGSCESFSLLISDITLWRFSRNPNFFLVRILALHGDNILVQGINNIHTRTENKPNI